MTTAILQEFRRRFTAAALREEHELTGDEDHTLACLRSLGATRPASHILLFGALPRSTLREAAHLIGPKSIVLNVVTDLTTLTELRDSVATETSQASAVITPVCANWTDLRCDLEWVQQKLHAQPVRGVSDLIQFKDELAAQTQANPLIADCSIAVAILPTLNIITAEQVPLALAEVTRVLDNLGRIILTCRVSDEPLPQDALPPDCRYIPTEHELLNLLEHAGFYGIEVMHWDEFPRRLMQTVETRRVRVQAFKGKTGPCYECYQAVIYRGPWKSVHDDDGHVYNRGERTAVCEKTFRLLTHEPYRSDFIPVPPYVAVPVEMAVPFDCHGEALRHPSVTKNSHAPASRTAISECAGDCAC